MGIYENIMMDENDDEAICSACNEKIFWMTKSCCIYSCYNPVCSKCKYCDKPCSLKQLKVHLDYHLKYKFYEGEFLLNTKFVLDYCGMYANEKNSLENGMKHMKSNIENRFKIMQQVHGKRLPDEVSSLITNFCINLSCCNRSYTFRRATIF